MPDENQTTDGWGLPRVDDPAGLFDKRATIILSPGDDVRTKAAMVAYQDAMRRCQTWRHAIRAALAAADAVDPVRMKDTP